MPNLISLVDFLLQRAERFKETAIAAAAQGRDHRPAIERAYRDLHAAYAIKRRSPVGNGI